MRPDVRLGAVLCSRIEGTESLVAQLPLFEGDAHAAAPRTKPGLDRPAGSTLQAASFFPPPVEAMHAALANLEWVLHEGELLSLTAPALSHDQFETSTPAWMATVGSVGCSCPSPCANAACCRGHRSPSPPTSTVTAAASNHLWSETRATDDPAGEFER